jgi:peptidyl-prolyl cis-trans isomerase SurA
MDRSRHPNRATAWLALACAAVSLAAAADRSTAQVLREQLVVDGIAAQVGNEIVLISEVEQLAAPVAAEMQRQGAPDLELMRLRATVLDRLIERKLVAIVVRRAELEATDSEIDDAIERIAKENGISLDQLRQSVEAQGMSFTAYRDRIAGEIEHAKVMNGMVASQVRVEDDEVKDLYERRYEDQPEEGDEMHIRHIAVTFQGDSAAARTQACQVVDDGLARIQAGEPFEAVAFEISESNPERGGDLGWVHVAELAPWMAGTLHDLEPGQTSGVIRPPWGCNLLQLVEERTYQQVSYAQAREKLRAELFDIHMAEEYRKFVDKVRKQTYIERKGIYAEATKAPSKGYFGDDEGADGS